MRALTLKPWWAHAVAWHGKRIENRSRPIPSTVPYGTRVAIHAGALGAPASFFEGWHQVRLAAPKGLSAAAMGTVTPQPWKRVRDRTGKVAATSMRAQSRAIVAVATLGGYFDPEDVDPEDWADSDAGSWWRLEDVVTLRQVVPVRRGQLGLWHLDRETESQVLAEEERSLVWSVADKLRRTGDLRGSELPRWVPFQHMGQSWWIMVAWGRNTAFDREPDETPLDGLRNAARGLGVFGGQ